MIKLFSNGVYLINNREIVEDCNEVNSILANKLGNNYPSKENACLLYTSDAADD